MMDGHHTDPPSSGTDTSTNSMPAQARADSELLPAEEQPESVPIALFATDDPAEWIVSRHEHADPYDVNSDRDAEDAYPGEHPLPYDPASLSVDQHVEETLALWEQSFIGDSTKDYCLHDCLFSALLRDERARWFRIATAGDPDPAIRVRRLHQRQLFKLAQARASGLSEDLQYPEHPEDYAVARRLIKKLDRLWICPPCRVSYTYTGSRHPRYCRRVWLCPWCNAREAYGHYEHILPIAEQEASSTGRVPAVLCVETSDLHCENVDSSVDRVLPVFRRALWTTAQRLGATGGLMICTVNRPDYDVFSYTIGFLRAFYLVCLIHPDANTAGLTMEHACNPELGPCGHPILVGRFMSESSSCATMLRKLMFGSDRSWDHVRDIDSNEERPHHSLQQWPVGGGPGCGAACLPPVCQFRLLYWFAYERTTHSRSRFTLLGSWQKPRLPDPVEALMPTPERLEYLRRAQARHAAKVRQCRPLDAENHLRQQNALAHRHALLAVLQPHWAQISALARDGQLPSRRLDRIRQYLQITGLSVSDRDLRWLSQQLPPG